MTQPPYTLSSVMPISKPPRPGWVIPVVVGLAALVVVLAGTTAWAITRPDGVVPATAPTRTTQAGFGPETVATNACKMLDGAESDDFAQMMKIGEAASKSTITDIRIEGNLLHDFAELAAKGPTKEEDPMGYLKSWTTVINAETNLTEACRKAGIKTS